MYISIYISSLNSLSFKKSMGKIKQNEKMKE